MKIVEVANIPTKDEVETIKISEANAPKILKLCLEMHELCEQERGIGLSAVQVGLPLKLFIVKNKDGSYSNYVNCDYVPLTQTKSTSVEGCLSLRKNGSFRFFKVDRFENVQITGWELLIGEDVKFVPVDKSLNDFYAVVFQHEIDHQNQVLISEIGQEVHIW